MNFIIYTVSGRIKRVGSCQEHLLNAQIISEDEFVLEGVADLATMYIKDNRILLRPKQTSTVDKVELIADGVDEIVISNSPAGTFTATNIDTGETVTGPINGTDTFTTTVPGKIKIKIESWPYLDFETTITAV